MSNINEKNKFFIRVNEPKSNLYKEDIKLLSELENVNFVIPKVESKDEVLKLEEILKRKKSDKKIIPIIETAKGLWNALEIATSSHLIETLAFGAEDFSLDIDAKVSEDGKELNHARSKLVIISRVAEIEAPIDTVYTNFKNPEGFRKEAEMVRALGFQGKLLIHPNQIDLANEKFTPTYEEIENAKKIIEAFKKAENEGLAAIEVDGKMVDYPIVNKAERILELSE